jgi:hypothetical protein
VKTTGDGILAEFPSVVDAVCCAIGVQQGARERNANVPPEKRIDFRGRNFESFRARQNLTLSWRRTKEAPQTWGSQFLLVSLSVTLAPQMANDFSFTRRVEGRPSVPFLLCGDVAREAAALAA